MNRNNRTLVVTLLVMLMSMTAAAQARLGVRAGLSLGHLRFDRDVVNSDNRVGYCGGLLLDLGLPVVGLGVEASVMYTHRNNRLADDQCVYKRDFIDIPVYARYRMEIVGLSHVFAPLAYTGPCFSILFSDNGPVNYDSRKTYTSWDVGLGADLFNRLRVTATYGIGLSKALEYVDREYTGSTVNGKERYWTVSAALLF